MSWSRILRFAKERQVPVIVTDETGEDPMILLSLDALEQALDGGASPVAPPQPPTPPRSTTPSFVPDPFFESEESMDETETLPESTSSVDMDDISVPPSMESASEPVPEPVIPPATPSEPDTQDASDAQVVPLQPTIIDEPDLVVAQEQEPSVPPPEPPVSVPADLQIMTPPEQAIVPVAQELNVSVPAESAEPAPKAPVAPTGISLEERFFLDF